MAACALRGRGVPLARALAPLVKFCVPCAALGPAASVAARDAVLRQLATTPARRPAPRRREDERAAAPPPRAMRWANVPDEPAAATADTRAPRAASPAATFTSLLAGTGVPADVAPRLAGLGIVTPTDVQRAALPVALAGGSVIAAAETGSGKTLCYALPIVRALATAAAPPSSSGGVTAVVLVPSQELCTQVCAVLALLRPGVRALPLYGSTTIPAAAPPQVIVATPGALTRALEKARASGSSGGLFAGVRVVALDEADMLTGATHRAHVEAVLAMVDADARQRAAPTTGASAQAPTQPPTAPGALLLSAPGVQYLLVAATLLDPASAAASSRANADSFGGWLHRHGRHLPLVTTPGLHRPVAGLRFNEVRIDTGLLRRKVATAAAAASASGGGGGGGGVGASFADLLAEARWAALVKAVRLTVPADDRGPGDARVGQALVFVATAAGVQEALLQLGERAPDVRAGGLHKSLSPSQRAALVDAFLDRRLDVLVATDVASRGLDTTALVAHVIQADLPADLPTFLHRLGRTARAGGTGLATTILATEEAPGYDALLAAARAGLPDTLSQRRNAAAKARRLGGKDGGGGRR